MRQPANGWSALTLTVRQMLARLIPGLQGVACWLLLGLASFPTVVLAQPACPGIHVTILDIRNSTGAIACALFESAEGFPAEVLSFATHIAMMEIRDTQARCSFLDILPGTYALAVIHDENRDGELARNWLGVPREGYGFSSGARASLSAPSFEDASFSYDGQNLDMAIRLHY